MHSLCHGRPQPRLDGRVATALLLTVAFVACRSTERAADSTATAASAASAARAPTPGRYAVSDFGHLRWLEGSWRGALPEGGSFFETYRVVDDSTIAMHGYPDSTFGNATDSARIMLRGVTVLNEGMTSRWVATRLDSASAQFEPERGGSNDFIWERESPDKWLATLHSRDTTGAVRTIMYPMQRVPR